MTQEGTLRNLVISGHKVSGKWEFRSGLEKIGEEPWIVKTVMTNNTKGARGFIRYFRYFYESWKIFLHRSRYKRIVSWDQFFGLLIAFYVMFFHASRCPEIYVMGFIYIPKKGLKGKLYEWFVMKALSCTKVRRVFVYSNYEKQFYEKYFGVQDDNLFTSVKLGIEDEWDDYKDVVQKGDYYVAAGRSNRDYDFLYDSWDASYGDLKIICDTCDLKPKPGVHILRNCYDEKYRMEVAQCKAVIIPLLREKVSSGQLSALHAAMFGKPVLYTHNFTLEEYVLNDETGILIEKDETGLEDAIVQLDKPWNYQCMSKCTREKFEREFSLYELGKAIGQYVFAASEEVKQEVPVEVETVALPEESVQNDVPVVEEEENVQIAV